MSDDENIKNPEIEVLPPVLRAKPHLPNHVRDEQLALQIRDMGKVGLTKTQAANCARISTYVLDKYYLEDYMQGVSGKQRGLASVAVSEAMNGNTPILLHLLKTRLGWSEQQVIEHIGEVRAVVSNKPLSKEEFIQKYLAKDEE